MKKHSIHQSPEDPDSIGPILGTMLDGLGFGTNTYK